jgi:hypothetical protein
MPCPIVIIVEGLSPEPTIQYPEQIRLAQARWRDGQSRHLQPSRGWLCPPPFELQQPMQGMHSVLCGQIPRVKLWVTPPAQCYIHDGFSAEIGEASIAPGGFLMNAGARPWPLLFSQGLIPKDSRCDSGQCQRPRSCGLSQKLDGRALRQAASLSVLVLVAVVITT